MTWFGWIVLVCWVIAAFKSVFEDNDKTVEHKSLEFVLNSLAIVALLAIGTGHL